MSQNTDHPNPNVCAVVVTHNGMKWLPRCLASLAHSSIPLDVFVFDNASTDDGIAYIRKNYPGVHLETSSANIGFAPANNRGIEYALRKHADYVFLLNQDAWIDENAIEELIRVFKEHPEAGIVSPMHLDGSHNGLDLYFAKQLPGPFVSDLYTGSLKKTYEAYYVNAAAWLVSRACIERVGGFDTLLFHHYGEDDNYYQRIIYHGFRLLVCTTSKICHDRGGRGPVTTGYAAPDLVEWRGFCLHNADVNRKILPAALLLKCMIKCAGFLILFRFKRARQYGALCLCSLKVARSRRANRLGGRVWLSRVS